MQGIELIVDLKCAAASEQQAAALWSALAALPKLVTVSVHVGASMTSFEHSHPSFCQSVSVMTQIR